VKGKVLALLVCFGMSQHEKHKINRAFYILSPIFIVSIHNLDKTGLYYLLFLKCGSIFCAVLSWGIVVTVIVTDFLTITM
jgi:hypothetical protein